MKLRSLHSSSPLLSALLLCGLPACGGESGASDDGESSALKATALSDLTVRLSVTGPGTVRYELVNNTQESVYGSGWHPSEPARLLNVTRNGAPVAYKGPVASKLDDSGAWSLEPGAALTKDVDIVRNFDVGNGGTLDVTARKDGTLALDSAEDSLNVNSSVQLTLENTAQPAGGLGVKRQGLTYSGSCNNDQQGALNGANQGATYMINAAINNAPTSRYRYWFGTPPDGTVAVMDAQVVDRLSSMRALGADANAEFVCENTDGECAANPSWIAYVWTSDADAGIRRVQFCLPYWRLAHDSNDGGDGRNSSSRVGVMVHEYSHLFGTDDLGYQETKARNLALNNWSSAYQNAENYRLFVMNTGNH